MHHRTYRDYKRVATGSSIPNTRDTLHDKIQVRRQLHASPHALTPDDGERSRTYALTVCVLGRPDDPRSGTHPRAMADDDDLYGGIAGTSATHVRTAAPSHARRPTRHRPRRRSSPRAPTRCVAVSRAVSRFRDPPPRPPGAPGRALRVPACPRPYHARACAHGAPPLADLPGTSCPHPRTSPRSRPSPEAAMTTSSTTATPARAARRRRP